LSRFDASIGFEKLITPHKAHILAIVGAVVVLHAAFLLFFWPHRWPKSYEWLLLPDSVSAYLLLALGLQHLKRYTKIGYEGHEGLTKVTK
jgi:ABC-type polysaccharide/polyol phosphate export permease